MITNCFEFHNEVKPVEGMEDVKTKFKQLIFAAMEKYVPKLSRERGGMHFATLATIADDEKSTVINQRIIGGIAATDDFKKKVAKLTKGRAILPKLSCWYDKGEMDINLIYLT